MKKYIYMILLSLLITSPLWAVGNVVGRNCRISWNANTEPDLAGYKLYAGTAPGSYGPPQSILAPATSILCKDVGIVNEGQYYITLTAYDKAVKPNESPRAVEVPFQLADLEAPLVPGGLLVETVP